MSNFKICHINSQGIKKVFIFNGIEDDDETFSNEDKEQVNIGAYIHKDDSIRRIKEKIYLYCDLNVSISELYLFVVNMDVLNPSMIYNMLTQNDKLDLTYYRLKSFLRNIVKNPKDFLSYISDDEFIKVEKEVYTYDEFVGLKYIDWNNIIQNIQSIGQKIVLDKKYNYIVNPFLCEVDNYLNKDIANFTSIQNKKLLFEYGNIVENTIYLCTAGDVLSSNDSIDDSYLLKLYYPELYITNKVNSNIELEEKRGELINKDEDFIQKNKITNHNESVDLLYNIFYKKTSELEYLDIGIKNISLTIHPTSKINLPLEILFKLVHSSDSIKLVKYNPGSRQENIYRLYTGKNIASNGKKIPLLYVENNYKKGKIIKLLSGIQKKKRVTFITSKIIDGKEINIYSNFLENGNIEVRIDFENNYKSISFVEGLLVDVLNENILNKINNFLEQSGYKYVTFSRIIDSNIEINNIDYIINIKNNKKINLSKISKCISSVFKMDTSTIKKSSDIISLDYKRVSNYSEMDSIDRYITIQRQKYNLRLDAIIEGLIINFRLSKEKAEEKIASWSENVQHEIGQFENKKVKVLSNPGINIIIKNIKKLNDGVFVPISSIQITNVTNIHYIHFLHIFIDSLMRLIINNKTTNITVKEINKLCKTGLLKDIEEEEEVNAAMEKPVTSLLVDGDPVEIINDKLDSIIGAEEDDWSSSDDEIEVSKEEYNSKPAINIEELLNEPGEKKSNKKEDDQIMEEDQLMEEDLSKFSISGNNNIFLKRLREHDKDLFLIEQKKGFQSYSKACPWQYKKYPVVLSNKDKAYIDKMDTKLGVRSYDEHITYGSTPEKKNHYICPRFWCFRDENGKQRSLSFKQVNKGECGGWNAVIPSNAKKITKGKRIFEFTDTRFHKEDVDTNNKLVYRPMYPGFQPKNKHPKQFCIPCCFTSPVNTIDKDGNIWELTDVPIKGKDGKTKKGKNGKIKTQKMYKNRVSGEIKEKAPKFEYDFSFKGTPLPTYKEKNGSIVIDSIKGKKQPRPLSKRSQLKKFKDCDQGSEKTGVVDEDEEKGSNQIYNDSPLLETFPLPKNKLGYLTYGLQKFLKFNCKSICQKTVSDTRLKENTWCLMRVGIEKNKIQSFISLMTFTYNNIYDKNIKIKQMKIIIIEKVSLEIFITLQNGNLIDIFESENLDNVDLKSVNIDKIKHLITSENNAKKIVGSYINFLNYLTSDNEEIDYKYLWDFFTTPNMFCETGLNLIIMNAPDDDITNKIQLICPTNVYTNEIFSINKPTILVYSNNNYYEPIIRYKKEDRSGEIQYLLKLDELAKNAPEIVRIMRIIRENMLLNCKKISSLPIEYNQKNDFTNNIVSFEMSKIIKELDDYEMINQIVNNRMKVVGLLVKNNTNNEQIYIPCYPSSINVTLPTISMHTVELSKPYDNTVENLKEIYKKSNKGIPCLPKMKVVNENFIVGIITHTNQFIQTIPEAYTAPPLGVNEEPDGLIVFDGNTKYYEDFAKNETVEMKSKDEERLQIVKRIKLESNFYNIFRNTLRIVLNSVVEKDRRIDLLNTINDRRIQYFKKIDMIKNKLNYIMDDYVQFSEFELDSVDEIIKCFGLNKKSCKEKTCCSFSDNTGNCELLLPKTNMINELDNEIYYYAKVADEILRYSKIKSFFFEKESFLQFEKVRYNLNDTEIILLEDLLINKYFHDIKPLIKSSFIKSSRTYDLSIPDKKIEFSNSYDLDNDEKITQITTCLLKNNEDTEFKLPLGEQWRKLGLGRWNKGEGEKFSFHRIRRENNCVWTFMTLIIKDHTGTELTKQELVNVLITRYEKLGKEGYMDLIKKVFNIENKSNMVDQINQGTKLELVITLLEDNYALTLLDLYLLSEIYELPLIIFSSRNIPTFKSKSVIFGNYDEPNYYILKIGNLYKKKGNQNPAPFFGILKHNGNMKISTSTFNKAKGKLFEGVNIESIGSYFKNVKTQKKNGKIKGKVGKIKIKKII